jgi:two-component system sensor histidine kinase FlrB
VLHLADAFSEFISASARLEVSYASLQLEVAQLSKELADRNLALKASLAENERVHRALQRIVESMPCGVLVVEADGRVSMVNPEARRLLELGDGEVAWLDAVSAEAGIDFAGFLARQTGGGAGEQEFCRDTRTGKRWLAVQERRLFRADEVGAGEDGRQQTILILRDVTVHKQAELERERARKATALSEVATTLAHEIRNPLASLELFAGLIEQGGDGADEWVGHLRAGIRSLSATVNNVLSFHGQGFASLAPLDLAASIRSSVEFARPIADEAGVRLQFANYAAGVQVLGNSSALQQLVLNLVCNAIRHTAAGGMVEVSVGLASNFGCEQHPAKVAFGDAHPGDDKTVARMEHPAVVSTQKMAVVRFRDTGCGIATEQLGEVFKAGYSGSGTTSGLGLAVCMQVVKQHRGTIRVESELGVGTTFFVEIPTV